MTTRAVVTGGAGFIGSHLVELLLQQGWDVVVVDDLSTGDRANLAPGATLLEGSVTDLDCLTRAFVGAEYVFHLAALPRIQPSFEDPVTHEEANVVGTLRCLEAARVGGVRKLVVSSSSACYGTPTELPTTEQAAIAPLSPYAVQKYAAEQHALILGERYHVPVVALRYFNVYGPRSFSPRNPYSAYTSVVGIFEHQRQRGDPLTITGDGQQARDFVHVRDVARANLAAARSSRAGEIYNVGSGAHVSINDLAARFEHPSVHVPAREGEAAITWAEIGKIRAHLGWEPRERLAVEQLSA